MQEEIFGPLLPIIIREKPLVLYVFSHNAKVNAWPAAEMSSGALVANDCIVRFLDSTLPFGGVGAYPPPGSYWLFLTEQSISADGRRTTRRI
uniref:aldehyde dehydrogenase (NAD(+)) n=1 Tax=Poecilia latipinna TaxID=48699 RepID=A0A3B3VCM0_9TELE